MRWQGGQHTGLKNAVALHHALPGGVQPGLVLRVLGHTDQGAQATRRQLRVAIECQHIAGVACELRQAAQVGEDTRHAGDQGRYQLFELAPFALPSDPLLLGGTEGAVAVQQYKTRRAFRSGRVLSIQSLHQALRMGQQRHVVGQIGGIGVHTIDQQGKLCVWLGVGQVVQMQAMHKFSDRSLAAEHGGYHDHRACAGRDARGKQIAWHVRGLDRFPNKPVDHRHHNFRQRQYK